MMKNLTATFNDQPDSSLSLKKVFSFLKMNWNQILNTSYQAHNGLFKKFTSLLETNIDMKPSDKTPDNASFLINYVGAISSNVRMAVLNADFIFVWVNERFCKLLKHEACELIGKRVDSLNLVCKDPDFFNRIFAAVSKGMKWSGELKSQAKDGSEFWVRTTIIPVKNNHNEIDSYLVLNSNITVTKNALEEKNKALENLILSEARYRALVENQSDLVSLYKADGTLMFVNQSFCEFTGKLFHELVGTKIQEFPLKGVPLEYTQMIFSLTPAVTEVSGVFQIESSTSEKAWISLCVKGLFDEAGKLYEILMIGRDVSELKYAELQKNNYIYDLERIAFMTSHNVRGPIATMLGLIELLRMNAIHSCQWNEVLKSFNKCIIDLDAYTRELGAFIYNSQSSK